MSKPLLFALIAVLVSVPARPDDAPDGLVWVEGGTFKHPRSNFHDPGVTVSGFFIGKYEVTQREWRDVMDSNPSHFQGEHLPVEMVSWYDCIEYCNRRSLQEGLQPYYRIDQSSQDPANENPHDDVRWTVTINPGANGYRLPTEAEWEYAAGGGQRSRGHVYSGSDQIDQVAWYWQNAGDAPLGGLWNWPAIEHNHNRTRPVGEKAPNELGLHDMSGNVREWCWDWYGEAVRPGKDPQGRDRGALRVWKGGGWLGGDFCCEPSYRAGYEPHSRGYDHGLRVCRGR